MKNRLNFPQMLRKRLNGQTNDSTPIVRVPYCKGHTSVEMRKILVKDPEVDQNFKIIIFTVKPIFRTVMFC